MSVTADTTVGVLDTLASAARAAGVRYEDACYDTARPHRRLTVWHGCDRWEVWDVDHRLTVTIAYGRDLPVYVAGQETGRLLNRLCVVLGEAGRR